MSDFFFLPILCYNTTNVHRDALNYRAVFPLDRQSADGRRWC